MIKLLNLSERLLAIYSIVLLAFLFVDPWSGIIGAVIVVPMLGVSAIVLLVVTTTAAFRERTGRALLRPLLVLALPAICFGTPASRIGIYARAAIEIPGYYQLLNQEDPKTHIFDCEKSRECQVELFPVKRIAFSWGGLIDNWSGVVYDPVGSVEDIDQNGSAFGGDLIGTFHLWGPWYFCSFT